MCSIKGSTSLSSAGEEITELSTSNVETGDPMEKSGTSGAKGMQKNKILEPDGKLVQLLQASDR